MTSPIYLGGTQMCERVLAHDNQNFGINAMSSATGRIQLDAHVFTVANPNGAVVQGITELSCYTFTAGTLIQGSTCVDSPSNPQTVWGLFFFNLTAEHTQFKWCWSHFLTPGFHAIDFGIWVASGEIDFDGNDGGTSSCWERP